MMRALLLLLLLFLLLLSGIASAQVTRLIAPFVGGESDHLIVVANTLYCMRWPSPSSISGANHTSVGHGGNGGTTFGLGIYPDSDSGSALVSGSGSSGVHGVLTITSSSFALTEGTEYRWCVCGTTTILDWRGLDSYTGAGDLTAVVNAVSPTFATAANSCSSGVPPSTTGALTAITPASLDFFMPYFVVEAVTTTTTTTTSTTSTTTTTTTTSTTTTTGGASHVVDDFERASLGANWNPDSVGDGTTLIIVGSSDLSCSAADAGCSGSYTAFTPANDNQYACAQFSGQGEGETGVCLGEGDSSHAVCCVAWNDGVPADDYWAIVTFPGQTYVESPSTPIFSTGDYIGILRTTNTTYQCARSTDGTTWTMLGSSHVISGDLNPGLGGAQANNDSGALTPFMLEVWEVGNGALPTSRACGS